MKIAIEAQRIFRANKHGMDFIALETIRGLQKINHKDEYYILVSPSGDHCLQSSPNVHTIKLHCLTYPLWEQVALPRTIARIKPDLLYCTSSTVPLYCPIALVLILHGIIFLEKRQSFSKSWYQKMGWYYRCLVVPRALPDCKKIITVSHFECNRIREALELPVEQITPAYNGYSQHFGQQPKQPSLTRRYIQTDGYLFFLGNTDPKKDTPHLLKAYSLYLKKSTVKRPLLIADLEEEIIDEILETEKIQEMKPYLSYPGYIRNQGLSAVYTGAFAFPYPSLRESFDTPQLEAMACGTPILTGNTSAMPEVTGEGAILIDPFNPADIFEKLLRLELDPIFYQRQVEYGLERVKLFSWTKSAEALLDIYHAVASKKHAY